MLEKSGLGTSQPCIRCRIGVVILLFNRQVPLGARYNHRRRGESRAHSRAGAPCPMTGSYVAGKWGHTVTNSVNCVSMSQRPPHKLSRPSPLHQNQCASGCLVVKVLPQVPVVAFPTTGALMLYAGTLLGGEVQTRSMQPPSLNEKKRFSTALDSIRFE